jgi:hypothetical protein
MDLTMQPSTPALNVLGKAIAKRRDLLVSDWTNWVCDRVGVQYDPLVESQLGLLVDILGEMPGPLRRPVTELWFSACENHGRESALRGLAAGEVVEELQYLRELLIRHLAETAIKLPARHALATLLRLNRFVDRGISHAVVGYTDSLVETLFNQSGVPISAEADSREESMNRIKAYQAELLAIQNSVSN